MEWLTVLIKCFDTIKKLTKSIVIYFELDKETFNNKKELKLLRPYMETWSECFGCTSHIENGVRYIPFYQRSCLKRNRYLFLFYLRGIFSIRKLKDKCPYIFPYHCWLK